MGKRVSRPRRGLFVEHELIKIALTTSLSSGFCSGTRLADLAASTLAAS